MPRIRSGAIEVEGLAELNRALKQLGKETQRELRDASKEVATEVASEAAAAARALGGVAARVAPTVKASAGVTSAGVGFGGSAAPEAGGAEFGANRERERTRKTGTYVGYRQFQPWRGNGEQAGYFVYPTIRRNSEHIADTYLEHINELTGRLGLS